MVTWLYHNWGLIVVLTALVLISNKAWRQYAMLWLVLGLVADVWLHDTCNFSTTPLTPNSYNTTLSV